VLLCQKSIQRIIKDLFKKTIDLILYSNYWIALCAVAMLWQTLLLLGEPIKIDYLTGVVFFATLFLYAAHRIVGISRLEEFFDVD